MVPFEIGLIAVGALAVLVIAGGFIALYLKQTHESPEAMGGIVMITELVVRSILSNQDNHLVEIRKSIEILDLTMTRYTGQMETLTEQSKLYYTEMYRRDEILDDIETILTDLKKTAAP